DGINYSDAGVVFAYGNATDKANYNLSDNISNNPSKIIYYRLRSVDIDGKSQLSETRIIRIGSKTDNAVSILTYPNPVTNELRITIPANWQNKKAVYEIYNPNGQVAKRNETASSSQTETINVSSLAPGYYIVKVICEGQTAQQKIIKH
ncbi:MAG: T9SS type A sorting domain-containing protein, partial [Chitinophagaceae bacterium]